MNPSRTFILRPVATSLLMAGILLVGAVAYKELPISALPEVEYPTIVVTTMYPGAGPDVMASSVTAPLEHWFGQMPGLALMTSISSQGSSVVTLQFALSLNIDVAEQEVQQSINTASTYLPVDLPTPPVYAKTNPADVPILTLALTSDTLPLSQIEDLAATRLSPRMSELPGVGLVSISGGQKPAVRIQANPTAMAKYGINLEDVRTAISDANVNLAKGNFDGPSQSYTIGANDQLLSAAAYAPLIIAYRNGAPVHLTDVASVRDEVENLYEAAWMNATPAVILNIQRQPGANIIAVADSIKTLLPALTSTLPASIKTVVLTDRTVTIRASVADTEFELLLTVGLVVLVIFLFLRTVAATIIPSVAVPLSIIGTFAVMYLLGYSLNNLTLMALTISTGFVVDDAIVMIENIARFIEMGETPLQAALKGAGQIGFTIISLTVSLIAVLIPLLFMSDIVGRLFREFAITLAVTILVSAAVSLTLTPMMSAHLLKHTPENQQGRFYRASERTFERVIAFYGRTLRWVFRYQTETLFVFLATLALTIILFIYIPKGFFPIQDTGIIQAISQADQTVSFQKMSSLSQQLAAVIMKDPAIESLSSFIGIDGTNTTMNSGRMLINLKPLDQRNISATDVIRRLDTALGSVPGIKLYMQPVQDITIDTQVSRTQYQYSLQDPNQTELNTIAPQMVARMSRIAELRDVASDQQNGGLRTLLQYDRNTAYRLGITPDQIDETLYDAFGQRQVSTMFTQLNQYHVILEVAQPFQQNPLDLSNIYISSGAAPASTSPVTSGGAVAGGTAALQGFGPSTSAAAASGASGASSASGASGAVTITTIAPAPNAFTGTTTGPTGAPGTQGGANPVSANLTGQPIESTLVFKAAGTQVPLGTFARMETTSIPLAIQHQGQFPAVTLSFNLAPDASLGTAVDDIDKIKAEMHLPNSVQAAFQGAAAAFEAALAHEPILILAAVVTVYIVLGVLYESYVHPITILSTLPSAGVGALIALFITGTDFSIIALIGIILLIGIVKKNAIMMIDFALDAERNQGMETVDAIYQASLLRFRPIMMTTMAALLGGIPLALGSGMGSELRRPLGITIVGGLIVSQLLTLYTTPVIYIWFDHLSRRFRRPSHEPAR